jgi:hypothetical protein
MTYTYAILELPPTIYAAVRALLEAAGYGHAFHKDAGDEVLDMHGIALKSRGGSPDTNVVVSSLLSRRTKEGRVELALNTESTQMSLDKAREIVGLLQGAIEAAVSDQLIYAFLTTKVGLDPERATAALGDFRELRQGSRDVVNPN